MQYTTSVSVSASLLFVCLCVSVCCCVCQRDQERESDESPVLKACRHTGAWPSAAKCLRCLLSHDPSLPSATISICLSENKRSFLSCCNQSSKLTDLTCSYRNMTTTTTTKKYKTKAHFQSGAASHHDCHKTWLQQPMSDRSWNYK